MIHKAYTDSLSVSLFKLYPNGVCVDVQSSSSSSPSLHFLTLSPLSLSPVFADGGVTSRLPLRAAAQTDEETHRRDSIPYLSLNPIASKRLLFQTLRNNKLEAVQTQCSREGRG